MSTVWLSSMDSSYLFSYALGNIISGYLEDKYSLRYLITIGLLSSSLFYSIIITLGFFEIYAPFLYLSLWILQGLAQSTVWPGCIAILGNWFDSKNRGKTMGLFSASASTGNFCSALLSGWLLTIGWSWMGTLALFAIFQTFIAVVFFGLSQDKPDELAKKNDILMNTIEKGITIQEETEKKHIIGIPFLEAFKIPNIIRFAITFACVKFLAYTLSMWIPFYLNLVLEKKDFIGSLVSLLELGAVFGGITCGLIGDKIRTRPPVISLFLIFALPCLLLLPAVNNTWEWVLFLLVPMTGFFVGGANLILASAIPADLAQNPRIINAYQAMATVTGIIDGAGGLGAATGTLIVGRLAEFSWTYVFIFMLFMGIAAFLLLFKISYRELQKVFKKPIPLI